MGIGGVPPIFIFRLTYVRAHVDRLPSFAVLSFCPISRDQPVEPEYSDVFIIEAPLPNARLLRGRVDGYFKDTGQVETARRVRNSELFLFFSYFPEPGNLAIVAPRAILGASRPDFR